MKIFKNPKVICSILCALFALASIVLHFVPFWTYQQYDSETRSFSEATVSIAEYVAFPRDSKDVLDLFNDSDNGAIELFERDDKITANTIALSAGPQIFLAFLTILFCLTKPKEIFLGVFAIISGLAGLYGDIFVSAFTLNTTLWIVNTVLAALTLLAGIAKLIVNIKFKKKFD